MRTVKLNTTAIKKRRMVTRSNLRYGKVALYTDADYD